MTNNKSSYKDEDILTLSGLEHLKTRSSMYGFSSFSISGIFLTAKEIFDNSVDEVRQDLGNSHFIDITFCKLKDTFQMIVQDDGRGVPLSKLEASFTVPGTSGKWVGAYDSSGGTNGIGAKGVIAVSSFGTVVTRRSEGCAIIGTLGTKLVNNKIDKKHKSSRSGTIVIFEPNYEHMKNAAMFFDTGNAYDKFIELVTFVSTFVPNTIFRINFTNKPVNKNKLLKASPTEAWDILENVQKKTVVQPDKSITLRDYHLSRIGVRHPVVWSSDVLEESKLKIPVTIQRAQIKKTHALMSYRVEMFVTEDYNLRSAGTLGAVNSILICNKGSSHIKFVIKAIKEVLSDHVDSEYTEFFLNNYNLPMHIISIVDWQHAEFHNQEKSEFVDTDFETGFYSHLKNKLLEYDYAYWNTLYAKLADDIKQRYLNKKKRDTKLVYDVKNLAFRLNNPRCYKECRSDDPDEIELLICEGVSSGDYVKQHRDDNTQAVFELTGKTKNTFKDVNFKSDDNLVLQDLATILGTDQSDTDLSRLRFGKIGILADADSDGYHIATLVFSALYNINPKILDDSHVFVLSPPLYCVNIPGKESIFIRNEKGLEEFKAQTYMEAFDVEMVIPGKVDKKYKLRGKNYISMCYTINYLSYILEEVGAKQQVSAPLLELLVYCFDDIKNKDTKAITKKLGLNGCDFEDSSNSLIMYFDGIESIVPLNGLLYSIEKYIKPEFENFYIYNTELRFTTKKTNFMKNEPKTIMEIKSMFKKLDEKLYRVERYKGIGEMSAKHLIQTCLDKTTRSYIEIKSIGNVKHLKELMGVDPSARKKLIADRIV